MDQQYGNSVLFDFHSVVDIDVGIFEYISRKFNTKYLNIFTLYNHEFAKALLLTRENVNPLTVLLNTDDSVLNVDNIYKDLLDDESHYYEIIELSNCNDIFKLMQTYRKVLKGVIKCDVLCHNSIELEFLKRIDPTINTVIKNKIDNFQIDKYDSIFLKYYSDILSFSKVEGKHIFISNYNFNLEPNDKKVIPKLDISVYVTDINKVYMVEPYIDFKPPEKIIERGTDND